jgi:hypothetical protein
LDQKHKVLKGLLLNEVEASELFDREGLDEELTLDFFLEEDRQRKKQQVEQPEKLLRHLRLFGDWLIRALRELQIRELLLLKQ